MSGTTLLVFGTHLYRDHPLLAQADRVLIIESAARLRQRRWHAQKLIFMLAAMRHYADRLTQQGVTVDYRSASHFKQGLLAHVERYQPARIITLAPNEHGADQVLRTHAEALRARGIPIEIVPDTLGFLCSRAEFKDWAGSKKSLLMEYFYRWQRKRLRVLMDGDQPLGGRWNFDVENREGAARLPSAPPLPALTPDAITQGVIEQVKREFPDSFGVPEPFHYPVTHADADAWFEDFLAHRLANFGRWEDAINAEDPFLFHSVLALLLNVGLLTPQQVARRAEQAYMEGGIPLQSAEGFIRQIIGWREFVNGIYWLKMPQYAQSNYFEHTHPVPNFFWTANTPMRCLSHTIQTLQQHAYTHHIPRLMLLVNFANLAAIEPAALTAWFSAVYIDAYDWVMQANVIGFLYADGGLMATKPYIASAAYIKKMSRGYCEHCYYDSTQRLGERACPFNALYWDFLARHRAKLQRNPRMALILKGVDNRADLPQIQARARALFEAWFGQASGT